jgi:hypothetical protein
MKLVPLDAIFRIEYGNQFDFNKMETVDGEVNFVSRSSQDLGVVTKVSKYKDFEPYQPGLITVTLGGSYLLSAFVQQEPFYTAQNIKVLTPQIQMSFEEKVFYCYAIAKNRFRYTSHGREANITLNKMLVPAEIPKEFLGRAVSILHENTPNPAPIDDGKIELDTACWEYFNVKDLFHISASKDELMNELNEGGQTPYVTSSDTHNGVTSFVKENPTNAAMTITANRGGSVGYFFYQPVPYKATPVDVRILTPKFQINAYIGLFIKTVLQLERGKYNYSRKMGSDRLAQMRIKLPSINGHPDWQYMESYIKTLPYSACL